MRSISRIHFKVAGFLTGLLGGVVGVVAGEWFAVVWALAYASHFVTIDKDTGAAVRVQKDRQ